LPSTPADAILVVLVTTVLVDPEKSGPVTGALEPEQPLIPAATAETVATMGNTARICTRRR
jgi:hypothetical protein